MDKSCEGGCQAEDVVLSGWFAQGTPEAADRYQVVRKNVDSEETKTLAREEFGDAMEKDFQSDSKRFWQTVRQVRREKQVLLWWCRVVHSIVPHQHVHLLRNTAPPLCAAGFLFFFLCVVKTFIL